MAKHLDKFTKAFQQSRIPFLLAEVITDGHGDMVDLVCRFANSAASALLEIPMEELAGQRFTRRFPAQRLTALAAIQSVAFGGSAASFSYNSVLGRTLDVTCYQAMYGLVGCILEPQTADTGKNPGELLAENLPGAVAVLELSRSGLRCLSFNRRLCALSGWDRKALLNRFAQDFSRLIDPDDWPDLLQDLLDAVRDSRPVAHEVRLLQKDGSRLWVDLRAEILSAREGVSTFYAILLDIDQRRRTQSRLRETMGQLVTAQDQLDALFGNLPGPYCLLQIEKDKTLIPLRVSQGLAGLLGCSPSELLRRLASDPLWPVLPDDREGLTAAAEQAWAAGQPLCHTCRFRSQSGVIWVSLEAFRQPREQGASFLYVTCFDRSREKTLEADLEFHTQLCELLLDGASTIFFDYDPVQDVAHIESPDQTGRRTRRTVSSYLTFLNRSGTVHPDDQKRLISAIRRAITHPMVERTEFRGDYDGAGWRWYQISWIRSIDNMGNVTRLLGKAVDISPKKAAVQRFQHLKAQQKKLAPGVLAFARLDLTADRILDAKSSSRYLSRVLFGNTADACLRHLRDNVPDEARRLQFDGLFRRDTLLAAFHRGEQAFSLKHPFASSAGIPVWVNTSIELAENPETTHITAFCAISNIDAQRLRNAVLGTLIRQNYEFVLTVHAASGACQLYGSQEPLPTGTTYRMLAARYLQNQIPSPQRTAIRRAIRLETILDTLRTQDAYVYTCTLDTPDGPRCKRFCCVWLEQEADTLLVTLETL